MRAYRTEDVERSLAALAALAVELERRLDAKAGEGLDDAVGDFVRRARGHLDLERKTQEELAASASPPRWWRYAYLRRLLDDVVEAAQDPDGNPTALRRLLQMWAFEPIAGRSEARLEMQT